MENFEKILGENLILRTLMFLTKLEIFTKCISINFFGYEDNENFQVYSSKKALKRGILLLFIEKGQSHYALIKDSKTLMNKQTLHRY